MEMNFFQAVILGVIQGLTEFLPVSSSAHLSVFGALMGFGSGDESPGYTAFTAIIQIGTELAVLLYFIKDIARILSAWFRTLPQAIKGGPKRSTGAKIGPDAKMGWLVIFGTLPIVVAGLLLKHPIETVFRTLWLTAAVLILFGILLWAADHFYPKELRLESLGAKNTFLFGLAQCLALIPGVSRSGATITAGRALGFNRAAAAKFSFYLAIPSVLGAAILETKSAIADLSQADGILAGFPGWPATAVATVVSFAVGYVVIAAFMKALNRISFRGFALYRIALGVAILLMLSCGILH